MNNCLCIKMWVPNNAITQSGKVLNSHLNVFEQQKQISYISNAMLLYMWRHWSIFTKPMMAQHWMLSWQLCDSSLDQHCKGILYFCDFQGDPETPAPSPGYTHEYLQHLQYNTRGSVEAPANLHKTISDQAQPQTNQHVFHTISRPG